MTDDATGTLDEGDRPDRAMRTGTRSVAPGMAYAPVNGLQLYYETRGSGRPLVLLHGGLMTIDLNAVLCSNRLRRPGR